MADKIPALSFSSWSLFDQCPKQYHHLKILKEYPFTSSPESRRGDAIHEALDYAVKHNVPIDPNGAAGAWAQSLEGWRTEPGVTKSEWKFALKADGTATTWYDRAKVALGAIDVHRIVGDTAFQWDWKTGGVKPGMPQTDAAFEAALRKKVQYTNPEQLDIGALAIMTANPEVRVVKSRLVFLDLGGVAPAAGYHINTRDQLPALRKVWLIERPAIVQATADQGAWVAKPNKLCAWCPVTTCGHHPDKT